MFCGYNNNNNTRWSDTAAIRRESVNDFLKYLSVNAIIGVKPQPIVEDELELPRENCVILAEFSSGY